MQKTEEQLREIEERTNTAMEVFAFLQALPSPLGEFVFKQIVEEAYNIAEVIDLSKVKELLFESVSISINESENLSSLYAYLGIASENTVNIPVTDRTRFRDFLSNNTKFECLPPKELLVRAYKCFSYGSTNSTYTYNLRESVREKISKMPIREQVEGKVDLTNLFMGLAYKTLFVKWTYYDYPEYDDLICEWFCEGRILSVVIDTVFKCKINTISHSLMEYIKAECNSSIYLCNIFQKVYKTYITNTIPTEIKFECKFSSDEGPTHLYNSLPKIQDSGRDISDDCIYHLHLKLSNKYIRCSFSEFKSIFSGSSMAKPITWIDKVGSLADFLYVVRNTDMTSKDYSRTAAKLFLQKNNKQMSASSLNQPPLKVIEEFKDMFNSAGIKR